jgi:F0F1-type ATP synthase membrane subunit b/b'
MYFNLFILMISNVAFAAGSGHGTFWDLKYYIINFAIFMTIFFWKILPMIKNHFREQHLLMKNQFHTASEKLRLARVEKEKTEKDLENLDRKVQEMRSSSERDLDVYRIRYKKELEEKVTTLEKDLDYQLEFEAMALNNKMYLNLINKITDNVESVVNKSAQDKTILAQALIRKSGIR